jgi:murein DD-endopeptidase MepM/ murein hydrolase activator NlpD
LIFRKKKYHFNPVTLVYEEIKINPRQRFREFLFYSSIILLITMGSGYVLNLIFDSHETRVLEDKLTLLNHQMQSIWKKGNHLSQVLHKDVYKRDNNFRTILQLDTLPYSYRIAGTGGSVMENGYINQSDLSYQINNMINNLNRQLQVQDRSLELLYKKALSYTDKETHMPAILPVARKDLKYISNDFGWRVDPVYFTERVHEGLDFVADIGKKVHATGDGIVTFVQYSRIGYGNEIVIDHKYGFASRYAHLNSIAVKEGDRVKRGQVIGAVGRTGKTTGPHLHYEVLHEHRPVNPSFYYDVTLSDSEYSQILNKTNNNTN